MFGSNLAPHLRNWSDFELVRFDNGNKICYTIYKDNRLVSYGTRENFFMALSSHLGHNIPKKAICKTAFVTTNKKLIHFLMNIKNAPVVCRTKDQKTKKITEEYLGAFVVEEKPRSIEEAWLNRGVKVYVYLYELNNLQVCERIYETETKKEKTQ